MEQKRKKTFIVDWRLMKFVAGPKICIKSVYGFSLPHICLSIRSAAIQKQHFCRHCCTFFGISTAQSIFAPQLDARTTKALFSCHFFHPFDLATSLCISHSSRARRVKRLFFLPSLKTWWRFFPRAREKKKTFAKFLKNVFHHLNWAKQDINICSLYLWGIFSSFRADTRHFFPNESPFFTSQLLRYVLFASGDFFWRVNC